MALTFANWLEELSIGHTGRLGNAILVSGVKVKKRSMMVMLLAEILLSLIVVGKKFFSKDGTPIPPLTRAYR